MSISSTSINNSATLQLEKIHNKVFDDCSKKAPLTEEEKTFLNNSHLNHYTPLTRDQKEYFIALRRTKSLTKAEKACFTRLGIKKYPPLTKEERDYLFQLSPPVQLSSEQKLSLMTLRFQRSLSKEEKEQFKSIGIFKKLKLFITN